MSKCSECGQSLKDDTTFCHHCGAKHVPVVVAKPPSTLGPPVRVQPTLDEQLRELLRQGKLVAAVKLHREVTGGDLRTSKMYVDNLNATIIPAAEIVDDSWLAHVEALARRGEKISAIKLYRERSGLGLAESKEAVERMLGE